MPQLVAAAPPLAPPTRRRPSLAPPPAGIDLDDARRKREDNIVQLRKDRRDENLQKKRMVTAVAAEGGELESNRGGQAVVAQKVRALPPRPRSPCALANSNQPSALACGSRIGLDRVASILLAAVVPCVLSTSSKRRLRRPRPPAAAARVAAGHGAGRVVRGPSGPAGGHHPVPKAAVHRCVPGGALQGVAGARARRRRRRHGRSEFLAGFDPDPSPPSPPSPSKQRRAQPSDRGGHRAERHPPLCPVPAAPRPAAAAV